MRIVVTGVGLVTPLGVGVRSVWPRLLAGGCGVRRVDALQGLPSEVAATVPRATDTADGITPPPQSALAAGLAATPFDPAQCRLMAPGDERTMAPFVQFALAAAGEPISHILDQGEWKSKAVLNYMDEGTVDQARLLSMALDEDEDAE